MIDSRDTPRLNLGCDPGAIGAIAALDGDRVTVFDVPLHAKPIGGTVVDDDALIALAQMLAMTGYTTLTLEHTWGVRGQGGSSQYKFGDTAAAIRVAFKAAGIRVLMVPAIRWTAALRVGSDKKRHVAEALKLFPLDAAAFTPKRKQITQAQAEGRADATLIAEYGRRHATR